jgi:NitT/TauT family transport system substrate-binding protein
MHITRRTFTLSLAGIAAATLLPSCNRQSAKPDLSVLRIGFFPNITHAQALVGYQETNTKAAEGWFEKRTGVKIEWYPFNAGPSAIEALLAGTIDATYVGPNPPLNGYIRTKGADIRVLTGSAPLVRM